MKKRFAEEQIIGALGKLSGGIKAKDLSREMGISRQTPYSWKRKFGGMDASEAVRLRQLETENSRLVNLRENDCTEKVWPSGKSWPAIELI